MPTLTVLQGPDKGLRFTTADGQPALLGRASTSMPLADYTVSRRHAQLVPTATGWTLEDLRSANGTYVNDRRIDRPVRLRHGDQIRMGSTLMVWDATEGAALAPGSPKPAGDLVDIRAEEGGTGAAIIGSVAAADDSMILASPAAAEAVRSWRVMSVLLEAVGAILSPRQLVERVIDLLFEEVPADRAVILMRDPRTGRFEEEIERWQEQRHEAVRYSRTIIDHVIRHHKSVLCTNTSSDERFKGGGAGGSIPGIGLRSVICVPLTARGEALGVLYVDCAMGKHIYTEEQLRLVAALGQMAGLVIEDARLVNERVRTERLAAAGETIAALSHYIKNILQGLSGGSELIKTGLRQKSLPGVEQGWQIVARNLEKIYSLTSNMLAFAKRREPRLEPLQVNAIVRDVIHLVERRAADKGVVIKTDLPEPMSAISADRDGIHQVVLNIVGNAIDAVDRDTGVVTVKTAFDPGRQVAVITVGDNGPGIPQELLERVFDPFYSTKGHGGTGLGLAVARKIVEEHKGVISLSSLPGEGSIIRVTLPAHPGKAVDSAATHGPA